MRNLLIALILAPAAWAEDAGDPVRYVRGSPTIADALERLGGLLSAADAKSVVFVFEQGDFGERARLLDEPDYRAHLPEWLEGIDAMAAKHEGSVRIALTGSSKPFPARAGAALLQEARRAFRVPPEKWIARLARFSKGKNGALVFVSGTPSPRWAGEDRPVWDPEQVAASLDRSGARLYVIMPEARFPEFLPVQEYVGVSGSWWRAPMASSGSNRFYGNWADRRTDCPSAFGHAGHARTVAATQGAYLFYPGRAPDWLDPCPFDVALLAALVPRLPSAAGAAAAAEADPVLKEIAESTRRCASLGAFENGISFPPHEAGKIARLAGTARSNGDLCAAEADRLAAVGRAAESGELKGVARRSLAQLRYSRFLLDASAFHCAAWADAAETVEDFAAHDEGRDAYLKSDLRVCLWSDTEFRLRDLIAPIPEFPRREDDEIRIRSTRNRLAELSAPLRGRAARVVAAAEEVMRHEALSPWGWMVLYSDFVTFKPDWEGSLKGGTKRRKPDSEGAETTTPPEPPPAPGSGGSGPTTGG